jgi:hypothetical protein
MVATRRSQAVDAPSEEPVKAMKAAKPRAKAPAAEGPTSPKAQKRSSRATKPATQKPEADVE